MLLLFCQPGKAVSNGSNFQALCASCDSHALLQQQQQLLQLLGMCATRAQSCLPHHVSTGCTLVGTMQLSDNVYRVPCHCLTIQVSVPCPMGCGTVHESQHAMAIGGFPKCGPFWLRCGTEFPVIWEHWAVAAWLIDSCCCIGRGAVAWRVSICLVCNSRAWDQTDRIGDRSRRCYL